MKRILSLALAAVMLFCGCSVKTDTEKTKSQKSEIPKEGGVLNLSSYAPDTLNPLVTGYSSVRDFLYLTYESLFVVNEDLSPRPVLAESYAATDGNKTYTIEVKKGVSFHNGAPFTASDVTATFEYIQKYNSVYAEKLENVASYRAKDAYTLVVTLKSPRADFVNNLDFPILPKGLRQADFAVPNDSFSPNGTGRYAYEKTIPYVNLILKKNPSWRSADTVYIPEVCVRFLKSNDGMLSAFNSGETDLITTERGRWGEYSYTGKFTTFELTTAKYAYLGLNTRSSAFADVELRTALESVIDKSLLADSVMFSHAEVSETPVSPKAYFSESDEDKKSKNKEDTKSAEYLKKKNLSFYLLFNEESARKREIAEFLKEQLSEYGVKVVLSSVDFDTYVSRVTSGNYQAYVGEVDVGADSDLRFVFNKAAPVPAQNGENASESGETAENNTQPQTAEISSYGALCDFSSAELDSCIDNMNTASDEKDRALAYKNFSDYFAANVLQIPLFHVNDAMLANLRVRGKINKNLTNFYADLGNIYIEYTEN